jgi:hypothetical protein
VAMHPHRVNEPEHQAPRTHRSIVLFAALWVYALAFGLLALQGIRVLSLVIDVSKFRTAAELSVMAAAAAAGTYLSVPVMRLAGRVLRARDDRRRARTMRCPLPMYQKRNGTQSQA